MAEALSTAAVGLIAAFALGVVALLVVIRGSRHPDREATACPKCQRLVPPDATRCPHCGRPHP